MKNRCFLLGSLSCIIVLVGCNKLNSSTPNVTENTTQSVPEASAAPTDAVPDGKTYAGVRGQIVKIVQPLQPDEPFAVEIDHEKIPDFMEAMRMTIPLQNAEDAQKIKAGDKVRFDMALGKGLTIDNIELLPATTPLKLAEQSGGAAMEKMRAKP